MLTKMKRNPGQGATFQAMRVKILHSKQWANSASQKEDLTNEIVVL